MNEPATEYDADGVPTVDYLRTLDRERLLTYFRRDGIEPPIDDEQMAVAAQAILVRRRAAGDDWEQLLQEGTWRPAHELLDQIATWERATNEPAA